LLHCTKIDKKALNGLKAIQAIYYMKGRRGEGEKGRKGEGEMEKGRRGEKRNMETGRLETCRTSQSVRSNCKYFLNTNYSRS
jgi:hypothetical protein